MTKTVVANPINLVRTTPPTPDWLGDAAGAAFDMIKHDEDLSLLMRSHSFAGTDADKDVARQWLRRRFAQDLQTDRIVVTNGAQNALFLSLHHLIGPGNVLLAEKIGYYGIRKLAGALGISVLPVEMDDDGADPDSVDEMCRKTGAKGLFLTPTLHNPTTLVMSQARRQDLADLARRRGLAIIEDDVYGMLPSDSPPPISAMAPDVTWHCTSPSKCVAPALRVGYLVAPSAPAAKAAVAPLDTASTWFASPLSAALMRCWVRTGTADRIFAAIHTEALERQKIAARVLQGATYKTHPESLFLWLTLPTGLQGGAFVDAAADHGLLLRPGQLFCVEPGFEPGATRIVLGAPKSRDELTRALDIVAMLIQFPDEPEAALARSLA
ncbi:MAG: PLP-dependent aminotransferase family protein [Hyphomonas sp.]|nr:PLP-dependent aminotransferase family protein [Hyphomonas sp.]